MKSIQVIAIGMATLDVFIRSDTPHPLAASGPLDALALDGGGIACNAMVAARRLGARAGFVGTFGSDRLGRLKLRLLRESGVDASRVVVRSEPDDQVVVVHVQAGSGERSFHPVAPARRQFLSPSDLERDYLTQADFLLVDGYHLEAGLQAAAWMRAAGKRVMLDANVTHGPPSAGMRALVQASDLLVCSAGFCQSLTGIDDWPQAARATLALGPHIVVQTDGARGSDTFSAQEAFHTPAFQVAVVDTTSAGDVFHGAYLVALLKGWDLRRAARYASAAAAYKCQSMGREGFPNRRQLASLLDV